MKLKGSKRGPEPSISGYSLPSGYSLLALALRVSSLECPLLSLKTLTLEAAPNRHLPVPFLVCVWGWGGGPGNAMGGAACISSLGLQLSGPRFTLGGQSPYPSPPAG